MKHFLRVVVIICLLAVAAVAIFLATFDVDRYRPQLLAQLQQALGRPVTLDRISLGWREGIAVQLQNLAIYEGPQASGEPLIQIESAHGVLELMPLLSKRVHIASIVLVHPRILVARDAQGNINLMGLMAAASPAAASGQTGAVGDTPVSFEVASLRIEDGTLHWIDAASQPPLELTIDKMDAAVKNLSRGKPMDVEVRGALGSKTPNLRLSGRVTPPSDASPGSCERLKLTVDDLPLEQVLPSRPGAPQLQGRLATILEGSVSTLDPSQLTRALEGRGTVKLAEPIVANLNILREVFQRFSMLPGLVERLQERLPPEYQAKLTANDTKLSPLDVSFDAAGGALQFGDLRVSTGDFQLAGAGRVGLDGMIAIRATLRIEPVLSAALVKSVAELQALTNRDGEMEMPLTIQGQAPQVAVMPDMNYLASKILVTKATDLLGELLRKGSDQESESQESLLGNILQRALQHEE
ncbi:MAG: AsmA family protein [Candidatus Omnitrophica bacterium]|nr:AsmA family protein [Candidatus Omnitrophota bacterium]